MDRVTVNLQSPSPYAEPSSRIYRFKRRLTLRHILKRIRAVVGRRSTFSLLEVGTGSGFLLSFLEGEYPAATLKGVEYDPRLVEIAQTRTRRSSIAPGNAESLDLKGELFDVIVSLQVVEHLYEPSKLFEAVARHLRPSGAFIMTTPNPEGLGAMIMGSKWHALTADHVSLKRPEDWENIARHFGLTPTYCGTTFFSGLPWMNRLPLSLLNWALLLAFGSLPWRKGESFVGVFQKHPELLATRH